MKSYKSYKKVMIVMMFLVAVIASGCFEQEGPRTHSCTTNVGVTGGTSVAVIIGGQPSSNPIVTAPDGTVTVTVPIGTPCSDVIVVAGQC